MAVRLVDTIDSETAQQGQTFHATLDSPLAVDGETAIPSGFDVEGHIVTVQSAGNSPGSQSWCCSSTASLLQARPTAFRPTNIREKDLLGARILPQK